MKNINIINNKFHFYLNFRFIYFYNIFLLLNKIIFIIKNEKFFK